MQDTELYRYLLGIEPPWTVERVKLDLVNQRVDVWANHAEDLRWLCPECETLVPLYDHAPERSWRHLDSCQFMTFLHARPPRINCRDHGVRQVRLPWADAKARFTLLFERLAIDVLQEADILGATRILRVSWDEAWHILERAVERGLMTKEKRICPRIGVDEKSVGKEHTYMTLVCDLDKSTVEYITEDRMTSTVEDYNFTRLPTEKSDEPIIKNEKSTDFLFQDESLVVLKDIRPHAPVHLLIVPRRQNIYENSYQFWKNGTPASGNFLISNPSYNLN